jgi:hypothetical protein
MKLKHLFENVQSFPTSKEEVEAILEKYNITNYTISPDLSVDVERGVNISDKNLQFIPVKFGKVGGNFWCANNNLVTLRGSPREVGGYFDCSYNKLSSLRGAPREVGNSFNCANNNLITLEGAPIEVGGDFYCYRNHLVSLKGCPREVGGSFNCFNNPKLKSLDGIGTVRGEIMSYFYEEKL